MSDRTEIEWTDATWNVVIGCDKVSPGCDNCYAIRTAHRMQANPNPKVSGPYTGTEADGEWTGRVNLVPARLDMPLRWQKPRRIFVNAQSDLFHDDVPPEFLEQVFAVMAATPQHSYQILTKRHARMRSLLSLEFFQMFTQSEFLRLRLKYDLDVPFPTWPLPNVWVGVSVENQKWADIRIPALLDTPAAVRFVSAEPLLGPIELRPDWGYGPGIDWIIAGGESGSGARPMHPDWPRALRDDRDVVGAAFLFKQWGEFVPRIPDIPDARTVNDYLVSPKNGDTIRIADVPSSAHLVPATFATMSRVGKHRADRQLDGRTWNEFPGGDR
ncbi:hypothetical protein SEA_BUNKER_55 [Gordonia phage Bunker]|nr:hypothetical protein SEA_BUNKER_55 [Gordonia phage Bunker]